MEESRKKLETLISKYQKLEKITDSSDMSEQTIRSYLHDFLLIFGWDTQNTTHIKQEKVIPWEQQEKLKEIDSNNIKPDYQFVRGKDAISYFDAKNITVDIRTNKSAAFQIKSYGWSIGAPCSFISNFKELGIYDTTYIPEKGQDANVGRLYFTLDEYLENFEIIYEHLSRERMLEGSIQALYKDTFTKEKHIQKISTDVAFANKLSSFRLSLAQNILDNNKVIIGDNIELLSYLVQILINRLMFIRICEAKNIEKEGLLKEFQKNGFWEKFKESSYNDFFNHYDGPLFDRIKNLHSIKVSDHVFDELIENIYPPSPYRFDVIPVKMLSDIYEIFLSKRLYLEDGIVTEKLKMEYTKTNGVVSTPKYIVDDLLKRTIFSEELLAKSIDEILEMNFLDFACGSGVFLVELFEYLQNILIEIYVKDPKEKHDNYFYTHDNNTTMTIDGKRLLISKCIYGIDIDPEAVEVARMSLSLKIVDESFPQHCFTDIGIYGYQILNKVGENIEYGNTLVSRDILKKYPKIKYKRNKSQLDAINPFDWLNATSFKDIFQENGGFDYVVGNPPYVEVKHIKDAYPIMHHYLKSEYKSAKEGKVDLLIPFIEKGMSLLNKDGKLGLVIQNRFFRTDYGENIREQITSQNILSQVVNFDCTNIFKGRITYISIMVLDKSKPEKVCYRNIEEASVEKLPLLLDELPPSQKSTDKFNCLESKYFNSSPWTFEDAELVLIKEQMKKNNVAFGDFASMRVGIQVLLTKAYHIKVQEIDEDKGIIRGDTGLEKNIEIEIDACRAIVPNEKLFSFKKVQADTFVIFPYDIISGDKSPIFFDDFTKRYPLAGKYLKKHKKAIRLKAKQSSPDPQKWHLYTRESHLEKNYPKVVVPMTSNDLYASVVQNDFYYCDNSNVNYTDLPDKSEESLYAVASIFNSAIFSVLVRAIANKQDNGYYKMNKQYIDPVLFPAYIFDGNKKLVKQLAKIGKTIEQLQSDYHYSSPRQQKQILGELNDLWKTLDSKVARAYKLTKVQETYFIKKGKAIDRIKVLDQYDY